MTIAEAIVYVAMIAFIAFAWWMIHKEDKE